MLTGANPGGNTVDEATDTLYVATFDNTLQVINGATCNAAVITGCGQPTPATLGGTRPRLGRDQPTDEHRLRRRQRRVRRLSVLDGLGAQHRDMQHAGLGRMHA